MIHQNTQSGRRDPADEVTRCGFEPSDWMRLMLRSTQPARDAVEQWFSMAGQVVPAWIECQRLSERWIRSTLGFRWPLAGATEWSQLLWGPWSQWLRAVGGVEAAAGPPALAESIEDLRRQVAALQRDVARSRGRTAES